MAAVLRVYLRESEYLGVGQWSVELCLDLVQILYLLGRKRESLLLVVFLKILHVLYRFRLVVHGEYVLVESVVHALQHRVVLSVLALDREELFYTRNAVKIHVLCNLYGIRTPRSDHLAARTHEVSFHRFALDERSVTIEPTKFVDFVFTELMVNICCYHALLGSLEKENHDL